MNRLFPHVDREANHMSGTETTSTQLRFDPPAPGAWELETTHHGLRPLSPILRGAYVAGFEAGTKVLVERNGLPMVGIRAELVHGCMYVRPVGIGEGKTPKPPPPAIVMKIVARLHPGLRRRTKAATRLFRERGWRAEVDRWFDQDRAALRARNLELQAVDVSALDDAGLAAHVATLLAHFEAQATRNLATHGGDMVPVGDLLTHCERWGVGYGEAADLLRGSSPATTETARLLAPVGRALRDAGHTPTSVDEVRSLSDDARAAVDSWLAEHGWRLVTSDDVDRPALAELPALQLAALLNAPAEPPAEESTPAVATAAVRDRVPAESRALFDELLAEARYGMRQRDDIRGLCWNWPAGLLRRALLEAGRRLSAGGRLHEATHVVELFPEELAAALVGRAAPSADQIAERAAFRDRVETTPPPRMLGEPEEAPPLDALPPAMARVTAALMANLMTDTRPQHGEPLRGVGIGTVAYRGRARVVADANDANDRLEPGDVLIAQFTGPSFNSILPIVGALVVEEGGVLCHAAIVAREFGMPAIIGAPDVTSLVPDGALVEVDPAAGVIRLV